MLLVGCQEGHRACKTRASYSQRFSFEMDEGQEPRGQLADRGSQGK